MTKPDRNRYEYAIIFVRTYEKNDTKTDTKSDTKYDTKFARKTIQKTIQKAIQKAIQKLSRICTEGLQQVFFFFFKADFVTNFAIR